MPTTVNGFGTSLCGARGFVQWRKRALLTDGDCDAVECLVALYLPLVPLRPVHAFNRGGSSYQAVPISNDGSLFLRAFLWRFTWGLGILMLLTGCFTALAIRDGLHFSVPLILGTLTVLFPLAGVLGQLWLRLSDRHYADVRYVLGQHRFGSSDPATWTPDLLESVTGAQKMFGTEFYADAVTPLLERGEYSLAMWAARLTAALERRREGERLTQLILANRDVQRAIAQVRRDPERWAELMTRTARPAAAAARAGQARPVAAAAPAEELLTAFQVEPARSGRSEEPQPFGLAGPAPTPRPRRRDSTTTLLVVVGAAAALLLCVGGFIGAVALSLTLADRAARPDAEGGARAGAGRAPVDPEALVANAPAQPPAPPGVAGKKMIDLIPLLQPGRDTVHGRWAVARNVLHCNDAHMVPRLEIPYRPPEEYDFVVTFSQPALRNGISMVMPRPGGGSFFWFFARENGTEYGFHANPDKQQRLPEPIKAGKPYTTTVQVRKGSVRGLLNGKVLLEVKTNYRDLLSDEWRQIRDPSLLAVACDDPTVFHYVRLLEITGTGKRVR